MSTHEAFTAAGPLAKSSAPQGRPERTPRLHIKTIMAASPAPEIPTLFGAAPSQTTPAAQSTNNNTTTSSSGIEVGPEVSQSDPAPKDPTNMHEREWNRQSMRDVVTSIAILMDSEGRSKSQREKWLPLTEIFNKHPNNDRSVNAIRCKTVAMGKIKKDKFIELLSDSQSADWSPEKVSDYYDLLNTFLCVPEKQSTPKKNEGASHPEPSNNEEDESDDAAFNNSPRAMSPPTIFEIAQTLMTDSAQTLMNPS
ncbi:hypothetical protein SAICODRAFT_10269 [Saitoella complicata NRRL Y-17804]|uniref:uncharacterized protein n=1 Tax=Saitoella complicata (strain BCRC 22490 / CBS 7301 / JCM 7358 / NBRC 10748 / NRRL Y-17804) TaxID=698492 RepID=UPI0008673F9B|nr:uncharacterized protein SAICODRAFT_10269 [Saitoella complicata NRRL Y-17804]ODQ49973.1 hypothetical protein SAICODRAFT_10269 [Saitoella complicata NRRL Y-17804]